MNESTSPTHWSPITLPHKQSTSPSPWPPITLSHKPIHRSNKLPWPPILSRHRPPLVWRVLMECVLCHRRRVCGPLHRVRWRAVEGYGGGEGCGWGEGWWGVEGCGGDERREKVALWVFEDEGTKLWALDNNLNKNSYVSSRKCHRGSLWCNKDGIHVRYSYSIWTGFARARNRRGQ